MKQQKFAKKSLGQNFLNSTEVRDKILDAAGDIKGKNILEIGPGLGFLTSKLLESEANLVAVEKDDRAVKILNKEFDQVENFELINDDFLQQDLDKLFEQKKYAVIANIPYNITNPILRKLLSRTKNKPEFAILMVQKEVAEKICPVRKNIAGENFMNGRQDDSLKNEDYLPVKNFKRSILSISVEVFAEAEILFEVGRKNFTPSPKVDSAIMLIKTRKSPLITPEMENDFFTVVNGGFSRKRKKVGNVLPKYFGTTVEQILGSIDPSTRAEDLTIEDWIKLTENFIANVK